MDPNVAPWRALEAPDPAATAATAEATGRRDRLIAIAGIGLAAVLAVGAFLIASSGGGGAAAVDASDAAVGSEPSEPAATIVVDVAGAVVHPGIVRLPAGARVADAIEAAGGFGPRVDIARAERGLNLAAPVHDGDQIVVPSRDDAVASTASPAGGGSGGAARLVDLNHATAAELDALPGIGPVTADKIVASRTGKPFAAVDDLLGRKLVSSRTFAQIKDLVTVG